MWLICTFGTMAVVMLVLWTFLHRPTLTALFQDLPDHRKVHHKPIPRIGGLGVLLVLAPLLLATTQTPVTTSLLITMLFCGIIGFLDDSQAIPLWQLRRKGTATWNLRARHKLVIEIILASIIVAITNVSIPGTGSFGLFGNVLAGLWLVGVANAFNLIDGIDGLCGGVALLTMLCLAFLGYSLHLPEVMWSASLIAAAALGFLIFNRSPARLFLGDMGSLFFGFSSGLLSLVIFANAQTSDPIALAYLTGFPVLEVAASMARRFWAGPTWLSTSQRIHSLFVPDANHLHHRLLRNGFSHTQAALRLWILATLFLIGGTILVFYHDLPTSLTIHASILGIAVCSVVALYSPHLQIPIALVPRTRE